MNKTECTKFAFRSLILPTNTSVCTSTELKEIDDIASYSRVGINICIEWGNHTTQENLSNKSNFLFTETNTSIIRRKSCKLTNVYVDVQPEGQG